MNIDKLKKFSKISTDYIFAFLIILSCGSVYDNFTNINLYISEIFMIILLIKVFISVIKNIKVQKKENIKKIIIFSAIYVIYQIIYVLFHIFTKNVGNNIIIYIAKLVVIFLLLIYYYLLENDNVNLCSILGRIANIVFAISIVSLIFYLLGSVLHWIKHTNVVEITFGFTREIKSYFMIYFEPQYTIVFNKYIIRNCGIFAEAPMFSIVLLITLAYETLMRKDKKVYKLVILFITVLTTMSTVGITISILLLVIYTIRKLVKKYRNVNKKMILKSGIVVIVLGIILGTVAVTDKLKSPSFLIRMDDYIASFKAWKDSPILGNRISKL